jgi:hypothetical protein
LHLVKPVDPAVLCGVLERFRRLLAPPIPAAEISSPTEQPAEGWCSSDQGVKPLAITR